MTARLLPVGWQTVPIGEVCRLINGRAFKPSDWTENGHPIVRIQNLNNENAPFNRFDGGVDSKFRIDTGELLFAWSGTPGTSFGAHIWRRGPAILNQHIFRVIFDERIFNKSFLQLAINERLDHLIGMAHGGAGLAHVTKPMFEATRIVQPPRPEQDRIVAEIEKQFTRLHAGVEALKRIQAHLRRYRAAVLKAACEGKLVSPLEGAAAVRDQLAALGKTSLEPEEWGLPAVPLNWAWVAVGQLTANEPHAITDGPFGSNLKTAHYTEAGPRVIRLQNIGDGQFIDEPAHVSQEHFGRLQRHRVYKDDVVIAALGERLPRACVVPALVGPAIVKADCIRFRPHPALCLPKYAAIALNAEPTRARTTATIHGVGRPRLNLTEIKAIAVPVPPLQDQRRIIEEVEHRLSVADETVREVRVSASRAGGLRQGILKSAFEGRLVPSE